MSGHLVSERTYQVPYSRIRFVFLFPNPISSEGEPLPTATLELRTSLRDPILFESEQYQHLAALLASEEDPPRMIHGPLLQLRRIHRASPFRLHRSVRRTAVRCG